MVIFNLMSAMMGIAVLMYLRYCVRHGGIHRETMHDWKTKEEAPKHFWFGTITLTILGLVMIVGVWIF